MLSHEQMEKKLLTSPIIRAEYDKLEDEYARVEELLKARFKTGKKSGAYLVQIKCKLTELTKPLKSGDHGSSIKV